MAIADNDSKLNTHYKLLIIGVIVLATLGRILPHPPNVTPFLSIAVFSGCIFRPLIAFLTTVIAYLASNLFLGILYDYSILGWWLIFSLTMYLPIIILANKYLDRTPFVKFYSRFNKNNNFSNIEHNPDATDSKLKSNSYFRWLPVYCFVFLASIAYWIWTNFGVWVFSNMYQHSIQGFVQCYVLALPFLKNAILGDIFWAMMIFNGYCLFERFPQQRSHHIN